VADTRIGILHVISDAKAKSKLAPDFGVMRALVWFWFQQRRYPA
jgi:hypothetical protein